MTTTERDRIFISYRRTDSATEAGRLRDALVAEFGPGRVFQDVDMEPGTPFPEHLQGQLDRTAVLLVVMAETWLASADEYHRRRIDQADDWVRHEIITGLEAGVLVVPVLMDNTTLPPFDALPGEVAPFRDRQWHRLSADTWADDLNPLIATIRSHTGWSSAGRTVPGADGGRIFGTRPPVVHDFIDREQIAQLTGPNAQVVSALHGIGGVGKSQLAAKFFRDHQASYDFAAWIDMRDQNGLTDYGSIAAALDLDVSSGDVAKVVRNAIQADRLGSWLLVFDNAERPEQVSPLLPDGDHVKVLITSRYRSWGRFGQVVDVDVFPLDVATQFLADRADRPNDPDAQRLATTLGCLPLGLSLAAALCHEQSLPFGEFIDTKLPAGLASSLNPDEPTTYDRAIDTLWQESVESVTDREPAASELIGVLALLDWTTIDRAWLRGSRLADPNDIDHRLGLLASYSLIELTDSTLAIKHNLIATGLAENADGDQVAVHLNELFGELPDPSPMAATAARAVEPIRHLRRLLNDHPHLIPDELIDQYLQMAHQLNLESAPVSAFHEAVSEVCRNRFGSDDPRTLSADSRLGWSYSVAGRFADAIRTREHNLTDSERVLGPEHPDTLTARANLAVSYWQAGRTGEAITIFEQVVADSERVLGPEHPDTLTARAQPRQQLLAGGANRRSDHHQRAGRRRPRAGPGARTPRHPHRPSQPRQQLPAGGANRRSDHHRRAGPRRLRSGSWGPNTPPPSPPEPTSPPATGRRAEPAKRSPSSSRSSPTDSGSWGPNTPRPSPPEPTSPPATGRRGEPAKRSPSSRRSSPTPSGSWGPNTPTPSPPEPTSLVLIGMPAATTTPTASKPTGVLDRHGCHPSRPDLHFLPPI